MPFGTAELPVLYRGNGVTAAPRQPPLPRAADNDSSNATSSSPPSLHSSQRMASNATVGTPPRSPNHAPSSGGKSGGDMFHSILRFLHLESGLPHGAHRDPSSVGDTPKNEPHSTTSAHPPSGEYEDRALSETGCSATSFQLNDEGGTYTESPFLASSRGRADAAGDEANATPATRKPSPVKKKKHKSMIRSGLTELFFSRKKSQKSASTADTQVADRAAAGSAEDDLLAGVVLLEGDEDEGRVELIQLEDAIYGILVLNFHSELKVLKEKTVWDSDVGGEVSDAQLHTIYFMLFRQMKSLLAQQFTQIFPHGIHGTTLSMPDVAACVVALCMVEMAITDDDIHSFAFHLLRGRRISLENCPPSKRYLYFVFMAFKSTVPVFRGHMDAFRTAVVRYFYDRNSIKKSGHPFILPLQALLNALAPVLLAEHFQRMTPSFYYFAINLEHERAGGSDDDVAEEQTQAFLADTGSPLFKDEPTATGAAPADATMSISSAEPATPQGTGEISMTPLDASGGAQAASAGAAKSRRRTSAVSQWSTIALSYKKASGDVIGQGANGTVYRCYDATNGVFYALKEISLITSVMRRRIRRHQEQLRQREEQMLAESGSTNTALNASATSIKLAHLLTERERLEIRSREKSICGEINMLKTLRNPAIVSYYGCSFDRKTLKVSILMEYCPKTLRNLVEDVGSLPLPMIAHFASQILQGIAFLHDNHVVHRDIKSANILVKDGGEAKVSDFGTAMFNEMHGDDEATELRRQTSAGDEEDLGALFSSSHTHHHHHHHGHRHHHQRSPDASNAPKCFAIQGTPLFLAPEVANGCLPTEASDIWSFGCVLIEMASGCYPWHEWTEGRNDIPLEMVVFHIGFATKPPILIEEYAPKASANALFMDLMTSCLRLDPVARPTARQLLSHPFFKQTLLEDTQEDGHHTTRDDMDVTEESGDLDGAASGPVLSGNVMSLVPNDSMAGASGVYYDS